MRQDTGGKLPLEARIEQRSTELGSKVKHTADQMKQGGLSEKAIGGYFSSIDYIDDLMGAAHLLKPEDQEKYILEIQKAIRTLSHGLTMGHSQERQTDQMNIANGKGKLQKEISDALLRATGTGKRGADETWFVSENEV